MRKSSRKSAKVFHEKDATLIAEKGLCIETACWRLVGREGCSHSLQWGNVIGEPYTGNPYVRFDEGTEVERPPPTLRLIYMR